MKGAGVGAEVGVDPLVVGEEGATVRDMARDMATDEIDVVDGAGNWIGTGYWDSEVYGVGEGAEVWVVGWSRLWNHSC